MGDLKAGETKAGQLLPEPEGFVAKAVIGCLRDWHKAWGVGVMVLTEEDIDELEKYADGLHRSWIDTDKGLRRNNITTDTYPVPIKKRV